MRFSILIPVLTVSITASRLHAGLPLPDHVLYGTIAISNQPASSAVVVQAQRTANGPILASYTMGSIPRLDIYFYELRFQLEDSSPSAPQVILPGEQLLVTVSDPSGVKFQTSYQVTDQGSAVRLDFGASLDTNGNGVPESWELANLGTINSDLSLDSDGDGISDLAEYIAGTRPKDSGDFFHLTLVSTDVETEVSFWGVAASGPGYDGKIRYYALESSTDPVNGKWQPVANFSRVPGQDQKVVYTQPTGGTNVSSFFRARVWLETP
jgi:hypothetical protein